MSSDTESDASAPAIGHSTRVLVLSIVLAVGAGAGVASAVFIALSDSDGTSAAPATSSQRYAVTTAPAAAATTAAQSGSNLLPQGMPAVLNSAKITVTSVTSTDLLRANKKYYGAEDRSPQAGGKFIVVDANVENTGTKSMDLTCGYPIVNKLYDTQRRQFDTVHDLDYIVGNRDCNANLQPGFSSRMMWVYEIPSTATPYAVLFQDYDKPAVTAYVDGAVK